MATKKTTKKAVSKSKVTKKTSAKKVNEKKIETPVSTVNPMQQFLSRITKGDMSTSFDSKKYLSILDTKNSRKLTLILGGLALLVVGGYLLSRFFVIAWVDGRPITRAELYSNLDKRYGRDLREQMIVEKLLDSEANRRNVSVSGDELNQEIKKVQDQQGGEEQLNQILQLQGISQDEFRNLVRLQTLRQKMFGENINISDEEVNAYIQENKDSILPPSEDGTQSQEITDELKNDVREQLKQQKVSESFNNWVREALEGSRVRRV